MWSPRSLFKRHAILAGAVIAVVPLILLLRLQYGWLLRLEKVSAIAEHSYLGHFLEAVTNEVEFFYKKNSERMLNLPPEYFVDDKLTTAAYTFKQRLEKKGIEGAKWLFFVRYQQGEEAERLYAFDPDDLGSENRPTTAEVNAILGALAPWKLLSERGVEVETAHLAVDERDPNNRIILNPIIDPRGRVAGVTGLVVDNQYFRARLLPSLVRESLSAFFEEDDGAGQALIVRVRDGQGRLVMSTQEAEGIDSEVRRGFDFIFTDWRLELRSANLTPQQWARSNFALNMSLSVLLALFLLGGIVLALRMASREMKLSQMKGEFVSNVSHELRTPLASVRVFAEFLRRGRVDSPEKIREYGEYIETESRRLSQLINNILDFSHIETGRKTYRFVTADVQKVVEDVLRTFKVRLKHHGFEIDYRAPVEPLPCLRLDAHAMTQALANLLDNAVKYSGESRRIEIDLRRENSSVVIAVADHGLGIARDEQPKIFERFHRVSTGLIHDVKGSGLGLAIVQHIVEAHGGLVDVESEQGKGSRFTIRLPVESALGEAEMDEETHTNMGVESHA